MNYNFFLESLERCLEADISESSIAMGNTTMLSLWFGFSNISRDKDLYILVWTT